jgi:hypothetical protein
VPFLPPWAYRPGVSFRQIISRLGRLADRASDSRLAGFLLSDWFSRSIDNYLDRSNTPRQPARRRYFDAEGNEIAQPTEGAPEVISPERP